jgi:probable F420-dependent oxidoreductase
MLRFPATQAAHPTTPFRFSVQSADAADRREWEERARQVEDLGFDALYTADHLDVCLPALIPLAHAAAVTSTLRLGTLVVNNDLRHPAVLAREAAAIDLLSDGRFELGIGAGHAFPEYDRVGIPFDPAPVRVRRLRESVEVLRRLLDGEEVTVDGDHYRLRGERCHPRPVQERLPLLVGGGGRHVLATAARHADIVGLTGLGRTLQDGNRHEPSAWDVASVTEQVAWVREQAGDRARALELQALVQVVAVADDPVRAAESVQARIPSVPVEVLLDTPYALIGSQAAIIETLQRHRERWGISHYTIRPGAVAAFAPVVADLAGS